MNRTRGFITVATGTERHFKMAVNLLKSYKLHADPTFRDVRFAVLTDKENEYTAQFDDVIILENPTCSYLDKVSVLLHVPYDETIFLDADQLAYGDLNLFFDEFAEATDMSVAGRLLPLDSDEGFFWADSIGDYINRISYIVGLNGGIYYYRKNPEAHKKMYDLCMEILDHYYDYRFRYFKDPADEPLYALGMALMGYKPIELKKSFFCFYPSAQKAKPNMLKHKCSYVFDHVRHEKGVIICHFGNANTDKVLYQSEVAVMNAMIEGNYSKARRIRFFYHIKKRFVWFNDFRHRMNLFIYYKILKRK